MEVNTFFKELLFSTVRIEGDNRKSVGTGFLVSKKIDDKKQQLFLATNKHVVAQIDDAGKVVRPFSDITFSLIKKQENNPMLGESVSIKISQLEGAFLFHPTDNVDLAILNVSSLYNKIVKDMKQEVFIKSIPLDLIPDETRCFDAVEEVFFVGYPNGIFDVKNHLPIIRKGITASPYEVDFNGNKRFLIDAQVFPGSSGSPVFIKEQNIKHGVLQSTTEKYFFVGVISEVYLRNEQGQFILSNIPIGNQVNIVTRQMIGLGVCEKANQIIELINLSNKKTVCDVGKFKQPNSIGM
jgi:hypothetical protein